jgi:hypothetical protein
MGLHAEKADQDLAESSIPNAKIPFRRFVLANRRKTSG